MNQESLLGQATTMEILLGLFVNTVVVGGSGDQGREIERWYENPRGKEGRRPGTGSRSPFAVQGNKEAILQRSNSFSFIQAISFLMIVN